MPRLTHPISRARDALARTEPRIVILWFPFRRACLSHGCSRFSVPDFGAVLLLLGSFYVSLTVAYKGSS